MSYEIAVVFGLMALSVALFAWERFPFDVTALIILSLLLLTGVITPREGLAGFSNPATVTIAAMFVLTEGLRRTGLLDRVGGWLLSAGKGSFWRTLMVLMLTVGLVSGFINNTAAVAIFIPVVITVSAQMEVSPSKLLIPMSFAAMFGGVSTLIGTSTNLLVSSIAADAGVGAFGMFDFTPVGLAFFAAGFVYMLFLGIRLLPPRRSPEDLAESYGVAEYLTDVVVEEGSGLEGLTLQESGLPQELDAEILEVLRRDRASGKLRVLHSPGIPAEEESSGAGGTPARTATDTDLPAEREREPVVLRPGDVLRLRGGPKAMEKLLDRDGLALRPSREWMDEELEMGRGVLVEAVVAPDSPMVSRPVEEVDFYHRFGAIVLAQRRRGELERDDLAKVRLGGGDSILLLMDPDRVGELRDDESFVVVSGVGARRRRDRMWLALALMVGVVTTAALGIVPIVVGAVVGSLLMVLMGCLDTQQAYDAVNWKVIFLLAGILPLGTAMETTGAAGLLADQILRFVGEVGPHAVLAGFLLVTMLLTAVVTNNATAVLLAPVAISAAQSISVDPLPLLMGVAYGASLSFITPVGYQTNTLVYGPGGYRFTDYTRVGWLLNIIFLVMGSFLIPLVFPF